MCRTQAKDHHAEGPLLVARPVPLSAPAGRPWPAGPPDEGPDDPPDEGSDVPPDGGPGTPPDGGPGTPPDAARDPLPAGVGDARAVDRDVPAAVGRVLDHVLADRIARARAVDPLFGDDLAGRVARFTRAGGKRTRPRFVWWALRACGGGDGPTVAAALRIGAALELLQTCALVHDDVMDDSALRRARPALHTDVAAQYGGGTPSARAERLGRSAAILAGDLALAWADDLLAETPLTPRSAVAVRRLWADMRTEMVAGQYLDLHGQATDSRSLPRALRAACLKSALYSVERPIALGAALAGADDATTEALCSAGRCAGLAFQLRDDLDDVFGDPRHTGKPVGGDIREGKPTYLVAVARARATAAGDRRALDVLDRSLGRGALTRAGLEEVREVLTGTGARGAVEARIGRLVARGLRYADGVPLDPDGGRRLRLLLASAADGTVPPPDADGTEEAGR
ncbi:polyprenyl synthetase family protein [Streptomyces griseomycini]|uniref:Geranylgeranyl diphosphate synthase type I n=1 Tax=Streptomyces griseomycini TaxID=66895 RepID=A0A7W7LYT2_9ACTN|nr:polyprenyl synthetase family protein [Streptomyces griseomycini]MBB4898974.1 geranylgeranyl diphosphate synthase type I [Streptomyces griseomycini]GGQ06890.1 geranylgeranyl pyrophosphate synthase [Streptomyces griseomycini]GGR22145.1 geranylgeranyl pyrophosphate synthase [Streptomyces griseomycini]